MKQERQGCMDLWLAYADQLLRRRPFYFRVSTQEEPLCGAVFTLFDQTRMLFRSASNRAGAVWMPPLGYGAYRLEELAAPDGYYAAKQTFSIFVDVAGEVRIDGVLAAEFTVVYRKTVQNAAFSLLTYDVQTGRRLAGAVYTLQGNGTMITASSDANGRAAFDGLTTGTYNLEQITPPERYLPQRAVQQVVVAPDGAVRIDGVSAIYASVGNRAAEMARPVLTVRQYQLQQVPVAGETFELLQNGIAKAVAETDAYGAARFYHVPDGTYTLQRKGTEELLHTVAVAEKGVVEVDQVRCDCVTLVRK